MRWKILSSGLLAQHFLLYLVMIIYSTSRVEQSEAKPVVYGFLHLPHTDQVFSRNGKILSACIYGCQNFPFNEAEQ